MPNELLAHKFVTVVYPTHPAVIGTTNAEQGSSYNGGPVGQGLKTQIWNVPSGVPLTVFTRTHICSPGISEVMFNVAREAGAAPELQPIQANDPQLPLNPYTIG